MTRTGADTEGLVKHLVESLVDNPEEVSIEREDRGSTIAFKVRLDQSDVGKVIGRGGRIIKAIRVLARAAGSTEGLQVEVDIDG
jgi:uncharacterized protein